MNYYNNEHLAQRIQSNVTINEETGCWEWNLYKNKINGYGQIWIGFTPDKKNIWNSSHRASYLVFNGPIPEGKEVAHRCHNPACCNPEHLEATTHYENIRMGVDDGRTIRGSAKINAKLTETEVRTIKQGKLIEMLGVTKVARLFDIHLSTLRGILEGRTWSHIEA